MIRSEVMDTIQQNMRQEEHLCSINSDSPCKVPTPFMNASDHEAVVCKTSDTSTICETELPIDMVEKLVDSDSPTQVHKSPATSSTDKKESPLEMFDNNYLPVDDYLPCNTDKSTIVRCI